MCVVRKRIIICVLRQDGDLVCVTMTTKVNLQVEQAGDVVFEQRVKAVCTWYLDVK